MKETPTLLPTPCEARVGLGELARVAAVMVLLALALYLRTFGADWTYDDWEFIVNNPDTQSLAGFFADRIPGRPLRDLSVLLDHTLFGLKPAAWHGQNILWHAFCVVLSWLLVIRLGAGRLVAWGTALLFLVHPLNVEVVASIAHRKDSLALAFSLLALLSWLHSYTVGKGQWSWRLGALLFWLVALQAKQHVVVLPLLAAVWEICALPAEKRWLLRWPRVCGFAIVTSIAGFLGWFSFGGGHIRYAETTRLFLTRWHEYSPDSAGYYPWMVLKSTAFMVSRLVWPTPLAVEYNYPVPHSFFDPWVMAGAALFSTFCGLLVIVWRQDRRYFFGLAWFAILWLPTSNLWPLAYFAADRYFYTPALGLFFCAALLVASIPGTAGRRRGVLALLIVPLVLLSWQQVRIWDNDETLYLHALEVSPKSAYVCNELGKLYDKRGEFQRAFDYYSRGQQNNPREASIPYNLGMLFERRGMYDKALGYYRLFFFLTVDHTGAYAEAARDLRQRLQKTYGVSY
ncbi:MAG: hypothetical protein A2005_03345 [Desulfuromonadales bacterium GWC2_61_20]|nr:MAG: hypothetical protein A2005_03345 [Desulfuromonadales bacterium GWC2_61_20]